MHISDLCPLVAGGERGIRTPGTPLWAYTRFPVVPLQPLGHLSYFMVQGPGNRGQKKFVCFRALILTPCPLFPVCWRREGDSNPRESFWPSNRFRVDPVTTTSVSLRRTSPYGKEAVDTILFWRKNLLIISAHASFRTPPRTATL